MVNLQALIQKEKYLVSMFLILIQKTVLLILKQNLVELLYQKEEQDSLKRLTVWSLAWQRYLINSETHLRAVIQTVQQRFLDGLLLFLSIVKVRVPVTVRLQHLHFLKKKENNLQFLLTHGKKYLLHEIFFLAQPQR